MLNKKFTTTILSIIIGVEVLSFLAYLLPGIRGIAFALVCALFLYFSLKDFKFGIYAVLTELILGSKGGYLFYLNIGDSLLSIRMAFWIMLLFVWFVKYFIPVLIRKKSGRIFPLAYDWFKYFMILMLFVLWGLVNGVLQKNSAVNIFLDFNAYLYFMIAFPIISILADISREQSREISSDILRIFSVTTLWVSFKTLLILFLFSHKLEHLNSLLYSWIRTSGVGEITQMEGGFYRVFFQSHIFVIILLISFLVIFVSLLSKHEGGMRDFFKKKSALLLFLLLILLSAAVFVSMSRSNWVGLIIATISGLMYSVWKFRLKGLLISLGSILAIVAVSYSLVLVLVKFPYPKPIGGFTAGDIFAERASELSNEAGVSSRWNLLPELNNKIKEAPLQGSGFGATVTYVSNDPRVRSENKDGVYTTFAFEWGWLDVWIKLGFFGFLAHVYFLLKILARALNLSMANGGDKQEIYFSIILSILCLGAINFFSPYLNHPLGIGLILFSLLFMESLAKDEEAAVIKRED